MFRACSCAQLLVLKVIEPAFRENVTSFGSFRKSFPTFLIDSLRDPEQICGQDKTFGACVVFCGELSGCEKTVRKLPIDCTVYNRCLEKCDIFVEIIFPDLCGLREGLSGLG